LIAAACVIACAPLLRAGDPRPVVFIEKTGPLQPASGIARIDFGGAMEFIPAAASQEVVPDFASKKKSVWIAGGLSLLVPGAGEFYAESYWKSAAFLAVEVGVWVVAYIYDRKGDKQTDYFQGFANEHWSVVRYATFAQAVSGKTYANLFIPGTGARYPWEQVNWTVLNQIERDIGGYFSHTLPVYGEQQYFELIGKYPQFNQGWDDAGPSFNYGDPLTPRFLYYAGERGKANTYYETASTVVAVAIVNHVVSAVDAAFTAGSYNSGLHADVGMKTIPADLGMHDVPVLSLRYGF
jgi:hypothetical protein